MASKYSDIIKLRSGKPAYNIEEEKGDEWASFIPNEQFNKVLHTVLKSVRGNDVDNHKSFWINGTYGTGKSHAVAVISHLLSDPLEDIKEWVDYEYRGEKNEILHNTIFTVRENLRLLPIKIYGLRSMSNVSDLALVFQKEVKAELSRRGISITVCTDFESMRDHIEQNIPLWETLIKENTELSSIATTPSMLINKLNNQDLSTYHRINDTLHKMSLSTNLSLKNIGKWLIEVQNELKSHSQYNGLLILWDEFTDVMNAFGVSVLKEMQQIAEIFMNIENSCYLCLISHPSAFNCVTPEELKQTDGRYHRMKYNMESVSAFKIMSRKFEIVDDTRYQNLRYLFMGENSNLYELYTASATNKEATREDLLNLYPLHPGTANLATHYATVIGSSSRSVFEFLGQNDAIKYFLNSEEHYLNKDTITADYLWDFVLSVFQDDISNYGAVTERYNSYQKMVEEKGESAMAVFKGVLLLNAFNNMSAENNQGLVTPSEDNIRALFQGTQYAAEVDSVLEWFNEEGVIQRAPGGLYSVQYSALPSQEIENKKLELRASNFRYTYQVLKYGKVAFSAFEKKFVATLIRPCSFDFFSEEGTESLLANKIKNVRRQKKSSDVFIAILAGRNTEELSKLKKFAQNKSSEENDKELQDLFFLVFDEVLNDKDYERFIEYQANYACASSHGFTDQMTTHGKHSSDLVNEYMTRAHRGNATVYVNGKSYPVSLKHFSSRMNSDIVPTVFTNAPDALFELRNKAPRTFWRIQNSKEIVRKVLNASSKSELAEMNAQMSPIRYLLQDSVDENLKWKSDVASNHPLKRIFDFINNKIKNADRTLQFNFGNKFEDLTRPPYGLYSCYASMAAVAFSLRPWVNKIFDPMGKPLDQERLAEAVTDLFKLWDGSRVMGKLDFKFQTPEESKMCKVLTSTFKLKSGDNYTDITSLKDARFAITGVFLERKGFPLWSIKHTPLWVLNESPVKVSLDENMIQLIDNIVKICSERDLRDKQLMSTTLILLGENKYELDALLKNDKAFKEGFIEFMMADEVVKMNRDEFDDAFAYIKGSLESTVGYWTESEVNNALKNWRIRTQQPQSTSQSAYPVSPGAIVVQEGSDTSDRKMFESKRRQAMDKIAKLRTLSKAQELLFSICDKSNNTWIFDQIIGL